LGEPSRVEINIPCTISRNKSNVKRYTADGAEYILFNPSIPRFNIYDKGEFVTEVLKASMKLVEERKISNRNQEPRDCKEATSRRFI